MGWFFVAYLSLTLNSPLIHYLALGGLSKLWITKNTLLLLLFIFTKIPNMNKKNIISSIFIAFLLTGLWFYIYKDLDNNQENQVDEISDVVTSTDSLINDVTFDFGEDEAVVEVIEGGEQQPITQEKPSVIKPIPDLDREIVFTDDMPEDARQIMRDRMEETIQELKIDPNSFDKWLYLGLDRKIIEDYEGAKLAWEYAKLLDASNFVVRGNLGDLYAYYLRDNVKAEENYLKSLELGPGQVYLYYKTAEFYRDFLLDTQKAKNIVQTGLLNKPNDPELQSLLNSLK